MVLEVLQEHKLNHQPVLVSPGSDCVKMTPDLRAPLLFNHVVPIMRLHCLSVQVMQATSPHTGILFLPTGSFNLVLIIYTMSP